MQTEIALTPEALRFIGALKYDPGYLLLCDLLQARVDTLTDELASPSLPAAELPTKLSYWRALRAVIYDLRVEPENFAHLALSEPKDDQELSGPEMWALVNPVK